MNKRMMMCMLCGYSQNVEVTEFICSRCKGPLVPMPQVAAFEHLDEYSEVEDNRRIAAENHKRERGVI